MVLDTLIQFKGSADLKTAIENVAFNDPNNKSRGTSEWLRTLTESNAEVKKELEKIAKQKNNIPFNPFPF